MNVFYPKLQGRLLPTMFGITLVSVLIAGAYGVFHDQITYSISPEYFTKMKFDQFRHADFGFPKRIFVAEIGFLATWWVGLISGWVFTRIAFPVWPTGFAIRKISLALLIQIGITFAGGATGYLYAENHRIDFAYWADAYASLEIIDLSAFVKVAYIHTASYLGGLTGLVAGVVFLCLSRHRHGVNTT